MKYFPNKSNAWKSFENLIQFTSSHFDLCFRDSPFQFSVLYSIQWQEILGVNPNWPPMSTSFVVRPLAVLSALQKLSQPPDAESLSSSASST